MLLGLPVLVKKRCAVMNPVGGCREFLMLKVHLTVIFYHVCIAMVLSKPSQEKKFKHRYISFSQR